LTATNEGQLDLQIEGITIGGLPVPNPEQFEITGGTCNPGLDVPPGSSCTIEVAFAPQKAGFFSAELLLNDHFKNPYGEALSAR
jgi:hypothetical protein